MLAVIKNNNNKTCINILKGYPFVFFIEKRKDSQVFSFWMPKDSLNCSQKWIL